jgi:hypothetical protein
MNITTNSIREPLRMSVDASKTWFESRTIAFDREAFLFGNKLSDRRRGAVYVYFGPDGAALYVGQTKRAIKARLHDEKSPHKKADWWPHWTHMRFIQLPDLMDRLVLEFLLILAYSPVHNKKPRAKTLNDLLPA